MLEIMFRGDSRGPAVFEEGFFPLGYSKKRSSNYQYDRPFETTDDSVSLSNCWEPAVCFPWPKEESKHFTWLFLLAVDPMDWGAKYMNYFQHSLSGFPQDDVYDVTLLAWAKEVIVSHVLYTHILCAFPVERIEKFTCDSQKNNVELFATIANVANIFKLGQPIENKIAKEFLAKDKNLMAQYEKVMKELKQHIGQELESPWVKIVKTQHSLNTSLKRMSFFAQNRIDVGKITGADYNVTNIREDANFSFKGFYYENNGMLFSSMSQVHRFNEVFHRQIHQGHFNRRIQEQDEDLLTQLKKSKQKLLVDDPELNFDDGVEMSSFSIQRK